MLRAELVEYEFAPEGTSAFVALIEPNGDVNVVRCHCPPTGKPVVAGPDGDLLHHLIDRYGEQTVFALASFVTLWG